MSEQIEIRDLRGRPFEKKSFYMVMPMWLWDSEDIPEKVKRLYALISSLASKEGFCWASNTFLANEIKVSERTIIRYIITLETKRLIRTERGENDRKIYMGSVSFVTGGSDNLKPSLSLGGDKTPPILSPNIIIDNIIISDSAKKPNTVDVPDEDITYSPLEENKPLATGKAKEARELCSWYDKSARALCGGDPRVSYVAKGYFIIIKLLKKYTPEELKAILSWYLEADKFNKYPQISAALSNDTLRLYSRDNDKQDLLYDHKR